MAYYPRLLKLSRSRKVVDLIIRLKDVREQIVLGLCSRSSVYNRFYGSRRYKRLKLVEDSILIHLDMCFFDAYV